MKNIKKNASWGKKKVGNFGVAYFVFLNVGRTLQRRRLVGEPVTMVELKYKLIIVFVYVVFSWYFFFSLSIIVIRHYREKIEPYLCLNSAE